MGLCASVSMFHNISTRGLDDMRIRPARQVLPPGRIRVHGNVIPDFAVG